MIGGADAVHVREFDAGAGHFVGGFTLPEAKLDVAWLDANHLRVDTDFGPGTLATSGYGGIAKLWTRGTPRGAKYPGPFIYTDTRDDRVHPGHARKFAAEMEALGHAVWFFESTEGGHGAGVTHAERAKEEALVFTYLWRRIEPLAP